MVRLTKRQYPKALGVCRKTHYKRDTLVKEYDKYGEDQLEEDLEDVRYEKQYTKFLVRDSKLQKRRSNDWYWND